jgi:hypothetical protein
MGDDIYQAAIIHPDKLILSAVKIVPTLSSCLQAKSSSWFTSTGSLSMTGRDMVFTDDSIISAPYYKTWISQNIDIFHEQAYLDDTGSGLTVLIGP